MRVKLLALVADGVAGDIVQVTAEQGEKLIRTGYAEAAPEPRKAAKE